MMLNNLKKIALISAACGSLLVSNSAMATVYAADGWIPTAAVTPTASNVPIRTGGEQEISFTVTSSGVVLISFSASCEVSNGRGQIDVKVYVDNVNVSGSSNNYQFCGSATDSDFGNEVSASLNAQVYLTGSTTAHKLRVVAKLINNGATTYGALTNTKVHVWR